MIQLKSVKLGDVLELKYGKSLPEPKRCSGEVSVYGSNGQIGTHNRALTSGETIIIGRKGSIGEIAVSSSECWPIDTTYFIDSTATREHLRWLAYFLKSLRLAELNKAVAIPGLNRDDVYRIQILLPALEEQRRIAAILDKAEALRAKRREAIAKLEFLTQSLFLDMFGDPRRNPKGLPKASLGSLLKLKSGDFLPANKMAPTGGFAVYGGNGISGYHDHYMFESPVITIGRVGFYCGVVHLTTPKSWVTDNALYVSEQSSHLRSEYLIAALRLANLNQYSGQAAQPLVSGSRIYPVEILVPSIPVQNEFVSQISRCRVPAEIAQRSSRTLDALFNSIQYRAFRGEI